MTKLTVLRGYSGSGKSDDHERQAAGNEAQIQWYRDALGAVLADEELELEHA